MLPTLLFMLVYVTVLIIIILIFSANLRTYRLRELLPLIWIPPLLKRKVLMK